MRCTILMRFIQKMDEKREYAYCRVTGKKCISKCKRLRKESKRR